jgi:septal ring factor EnvC (AmiA/AmiB activator)
MFFLFFGKSGKQKFLLINVILWKKIIVAFFFFFAEVTIKQLRDKLKDCEEKIEATAEAKNKKKKKKLKLFFSIKSIKSGVIEFICRHTANFDIFFFYQLFITWD